MPKCKYPGGIVVRICDTCRDIAGPEAPAGCKCPDHHGLKAPGMHHHRTARIYNGSPRGKGVEANAKDA